MGSVSLMRRYSLFQPEGLEKVRPQLAEQTYNRVCALLDHEPFLGLAGYCYLYIGELELGCGGA